MKIINQRAFEEQQEYDMVVENATPMTTDTTDLYQTFVDYFQPTCVEIGSLIGVLNFRGGYEDMTSLYVYILTLDKTTEEGKQKILDAHTIAFRWSAANDFCNHEANKLGWKPSKWWKWCWEQWDNGARNGVEASTPKAD